MQCPLKNCSNRAFHFLHPPCSIRMHRKYMYKGFWFLKWEIHYMRLHTVKNKSICYGFLMLPWTWPVTVSLSFNGNWETVIHWLLSFTSSTFWLKIKNKRNIKNSSVLKSMCTSSFWQTSWSKVFKYVCDYFVLLIH